MMREEVKSIVFRYIFGYCNTHRINSFNEDGLPPVAKKQLLNLPIMLPDICFRFWVFYDCTFLENSTQWAQQKQWRWEKLKEQ